MPFCLLCGPQQANDRFHRRCGRAAAQARLVPAEDRLLPKPARLPTPSSTCACAAGGYSRTNSRRLWIPGHRASASGSWSSSGVARLWQMATSPVSGSSSHTRCSMRATTCSALGARKLYALEQQNLGREPGAPQLLQFIVRVPSFAVFDHRYLDVYFVPGFYKVINEEVNLKGLEVGCTTWMSRTV